MSTLPAVPKYCYSHPKSPDDLARLRQHTDQLAVCAEAPNTVKTYASAWRIFERWCSDWRECGSLPAEPETIQEFIAWGTQMRNPPYSYATIRLIVAGVSRKHRDAGLCVPSNRKVRAVLSGVARQTARQGARPETAGKKHLTVEQLRKICLSLGTSKPIEIRDRAILLLGFTSALRRSNLAAIETAHLSADGGNLRLWVPYSKTDQMGEGRSLLIPSSQDALFCPVRALEAWKTVRHERVGHFDGSLFLRCVNGHMTPVGIKGASINLLLKRRLEEIGEQPDDYGAHSMRSGMITAADAAGASLRTIMERSGHQSIEMVMRYIKPRQGADPLAGVL